MKSSPSEPTASRKDHRSASFGPIRHLMGVVGIALVLAIWLFVKSYKESWITGFHAGDSQAGIKCHVSSPPVNMMPESFACLAWAGEYRFGAVCFDGDTIWHFGPYQYHRGKFYSL